MSRHRKIRVHSINLANATLLLARGDGDKVIEDQSNHAQMTRFG